MHTPIKTIRVAPAPAKIHPPKPIRNQIGKCQHSIYWPDHQDRPHGCSFCRPEVDADFLKDRRDVMKQAKTFVMPRILHQKISPLPTCTTLRAARSVSRKSTLKNRTALGRVRNVAKCGKAGRMSEPLSYDSFQFGGKRRQAVSTETCISYEDYRTIHNAWHAARRRVVPPFAFNDKKLAEVIKRMAWRYVHGGSMEMPQTSRAKN